MKKENSPWPWWIILTWQMVAVMIIAMRGGTFVQSMCMDDIGVDLVQEWASVRNWFTGLPVYEDHAVSLPRHLPKLFGDATKVRIAIHYNAHPPSSVLIVLPLGLLSYGQALLVWNILSLLLIALAIYQIVRELAIQLPAWFWLPGLALLMLYNPLQQQVNQGQLNGLLLFMLTQAWVADRRGHSRWAGVWLGLATVLKLFPGALFLYLLMRGCWRGLMAGMFTVLAVTLLTVLVLGMETYYDYVQRVIPTLNEFRASKLNSSIWGFWIKLLIGSSLEKVTAWVVMPWLAWLFIGIGCGLVTWAMAWVAWRSQTQEQGDAAFALSLTGMALLSPITWDHSLLLLTMPLFWLWKQIRPGEVVNRVSLFIILAIYGYNLNAERILLERDGIWPVQMGPAFTLGVLSIYFYTLLAMFLMQLYFCRKLLHGQAGTERPPA